MKQVTKITTVFLVSFIFLFLILPKPSFAAGLVINEFSSASIPEWVELYNPDEQNYSLKGVILFFDSSSDTSQKVSFCDSDEILAKSYKLITRPSSSFWLANTGDTLILKKEDDIIDSIAYGSGQSLKAPTATQSANRVPDGGESFTNGTPSPHQENEASFTCPTPTTTPTPPPTNTPTLTSTKIPTPTASIPLDIDTASDSSDVLGESTDSALIFEDAITPIEERVEFSKETKILGENNFAKLAISIGVILMIACGILAFRSYRRGKNDPFDSAQGHSE